MSYKSIYRKYRPLLFSDVIGQNAVVKALKTAVIQNSFSHAYLFAGPRGTGKTSLAKIFARSINCLNQTDGEACNQCELCLGIIQGHAIDVLEIDAASNNGVDEIRELKHNIELSPAHAKYKVYIIDEVHMLSNAAFNALLKTIEEPPNHAVFILATTEYYKIPSTITSRCQNYNFLNVPISDLTQNLERILKLEACKYEPSALYQIASLAKGSVRDSLSLLEQAILFTDHNLTIAGVNAVFGLVESNDKKVLLKSLLDNDNATLIKLTNQLVKKNINFNLLLINILELLMENLEFKLLGENTINNYPSNNIWIEELGLAKEQLMQLIEVILKSISNAEYNNYDSKMHFELTMLQCMKEINTSSVNYNGENNQNNNSIMEKITNKEPNTEQVFVKEEPVNHHLNENVLSNNLLNDISSQIFQIKTEQENQNAVSELKNINFDIEFIINILLQSNKEHRLILENKLNQSCENLSILKKCPKFVAFYQVKVAASFQQATLIITMSKVQANWINHLVKDDQIREQIFGILNINSIIIAISQAEWINVKEDYLHMKRTNRFPNLMKFDVHSFYSSHSLDLNQDEILLNKSEFEKGSAVFNDFKVVK